MASSSKICAENKGDPFLWTPLFFAWLFSLVAALGTLFFSEVMKFPPCVLCWYQRIAMYPLAIIFAIGIWNRDTNVRRYALPFIGLGFGTALYHNLLYYHFISESLSPCTEGLSCTTPQIEWLGFISIPFLSLTAFTLIGVFFFLFWRQTRRLIQ